MFVFALHKVKPQKTEPLDTCIAISPDGLGNAIDTLRACGFRFVSFEEVLACRVPMRELPPETALLTFDDGYVNFIAHAVPVLENRGCPAINFIVANRLGGTNEWDSGHLPLEHRERLMSQAQLESFSNHPLIRFGSPGYGTQI